jgi:DNA invertase Pin-like site-specific DNA recombinase
MLSQSGEGWTCLPKTYDDGGISGGHMQRPGLKALLADVEAGLVDVIVVYKVDRLTRSLADFSKLVEVFDTHDVSFVSVTQAFNTTNSMGRLTLNVLLSFAQFEREVTGERIRDKIAMSRKRGLWTGGLPPLGYDAIDKKLVVNTEEADTVRYIYERYAVLKNVRKLQIDLTAKGYISKRRITKTGRAMGGKSFERGAIYEILKNQTYLGLTTHKDEAFEGEHAPIIAKPLFEKVQRILASNRRRDKQKTGAKNPSLLAGKIVTQAGITLTPSHAQTHGRRYRYYIERRKVDAASKLTDRPIRLPASEIENSVRRSLAVYLSDPIKLIDSLGLSNSAQETQHVTHSQAKTMARSLHQPVMDAKSKDIVMRLVKRVELKASAKGYKLILNVAVLAQLLEVPANAEFEDSVIDVSLKLQTCNNGKKVIVGNMSLSKPEPNPVLIDTLKTAHIIKQRFMGVDAQSFATIAADLNMDVR